MLLPGPGPGFLVVALGAALIAEESYSAARALDWLEVKVRRLLGWTRPGWKRAPIALKVLVVVVAAGAMGSTGYGTYKLLFAS